MPRKSKISNKAVKRNIKNKPKKNKKYKKATIPKAIENKHGYKHLVKNFHINAMLAGVLMKLMFLIFMLDMTNRRVKVVS